MMNESFLTSRRGFLAVLAAALGTSARGDAGKPKRLLLRSSWQTVNIGDIAHTPGMLTILEKHLPNVQVTLWPSSVSDGVEELLLKRFPKLAIAKSAEQKQSALAECDFCLHGSGPGLVAAGDLEKWQATGKPYGIGGITLSDGELTGRRTVLAGAKFIFCRDTDSLKALKATGIDVPLMGFGPDATFAMDLRDDVWAQSYLNEQSLKPKQFLCAVPRLRWTPYWKIHPERKFTAEQVAERTAVNEKYREADHGKLRQAIIAWVRETGLPVLLCPEMTYQVELLRPLLFDPLPEDVKKKVVVRPEYWMPSQAASTYAQAFAVVSLEMHSPIIAIANSTPAIHLREPTDTRKGQMWRDVRLGDWLFEIDETTGPQIGERLLGMYRQPERTKEMVTHARSVVSARFDAMMKSVEQGLTT